MLVRICVLMFLLLFVGCAGGPHLRLNALVGYQAYQELPPGSSWPQVKQVGLLVHSDTTGPGAAPAIVQNFLETLGRRTQNVLTTRCGVSAVVPIAFQPVSQKDSIQQTLQAKGKDNHLSHVVLVVLSSREHAAPATLGEERMMTQMSGTVIENTALAEVAALRLADFRVLFAIPASATETLELLDAPLGTQPLSREESLSILRAQAAQQALDKSLNVFGEWCERTSATP